MGGLSIWHWIIAITFTALQIYPMALILARTGKSKWWSAICIFPLWGIIVVAWIVAFSRWPSQEN